MANAAKETVVNVDLTPVIERLETIITILQTSSDQVIFLLQTIAIAVCFNWGVLMVKLYIQSKNQKSLL